MTNRCSGLISILVLSILLLTAMDAPAQSRGGRSASPPPPPTLKREFRGVWVATVNNLDYPKKPTTWPTAQKEEWKNLLKKLKELGFNAVIFQVRPAGDAFYFSEYAPWSEYLTGRQGMPPKPEYDVLQFLIEETHKNGMEFHAWFNPFRATMGLDTSALHPLHVFNRHRNWVVQYGRRFYLNPGIPQVREHVRDVVAEVVSKYDVDGVHFDDYFYPYPIVNEVFPDSLDFRMYGSAYKDLGDWRRSNVDAVVEMVSTSIKEIKPNVYFGVSPFGVWRNKDKDPMGSETRASIGSYDDLYADILGWLRNGWIDYVAPQIYWNIGFAPADYATLQRWWSLHVSDRQLYIGQAAYKVGNDRQEQWNEPGEIGRQINLNRRNRRVNGAVLFRAESVLSDPLGLKDSLRLYFKEPALLPERPELSQGIFSAPALQKVKNQRGKARVIWRPAKQDREKPPAYYVVYRFAGNGAGDMDNPRNIRYISSFNEKSKKFQYIDSSIDEGQTYTYLVTAANRAHTESGASEAAAVTRQNNRVRKYKAPKRSKRRRN
ncbi:MAG: family 10 glycosylhydrolase [Lewinellaceae bacterium]|nr:family 10 glycosylhydrolase [Phaeodactylibacter sp.]MCB0615184.1 family 10 glycosylhydrolase [Phaeodactylibacter sp.]MCB9348757.1 family 10 glycosylhydrolase [Lewinellaceae bacterium]